MTLVSIEMDLDVTDFDGNIRFLIESYLENISDVLENNGVNCLVDSLNVECISS